jgi:hypothetical protein
MSARILSSRETIQASAVSRKNDVNGCLDSTGLNLVAFQERYKMLREN